MTIESTNLWMSGNADGGEVSNCHFDMSDNLQVVVEGSKTLTLIPPADTPFLYPVQPADGLGAFESAYSGIEDLSAGSGEEETLRQYPKLAQAKRISVTLNAGDVLFIPRLWWHQVSSSVGTPATSVNFWFRNAYSFSDLLAREMIRLNYDLYLEKRAHTLRHTRWQRFLAEASRIALGPEPVPPMNVMYSHNPADLEDGNGAAGTVGLTLADKAKEAEWSTGVAVPITAKGGACERKGFLFSYEEMGPRVESGAEGGSFDWDDEGAPAALEGRGGSNGAKSGLGKLSARMRARFEEAMDRSASLRASGRLEASLVYLQRAVSVLPEHFDARWQHSAVLMDLDRTEAALRQLRCAVPTVPARRLQEFFVRYLWLLYKLERHSVAQQLMPVAARYVPLLPPWVLPTQLTHGPYLPSAEDGQPVPYHDEWCEASGVCGTVSAAVPELKDELQGLLEALNETEFGVVDAFVPTPAEEQRAKPFGQGGDLVLLDQESGVVNATACAMLPKHCALLRSLPLAFQRMEDPDSRYGWRGVPAQASVRFVNPWSRSTALLTQESNDMLMMFAPIIVPKTPSQPAPWTVIGGEKVLMREGVPLVFDPAFFFSAFSPMKQPMFMLVVSFFKPPLCAMRRCALTAEEMLPPALRDDFTQGGTIPVIDWVLGRAQTMDEAAALDEGHGGADEQQAVVWSEALVEAHIAAFAPAAVTHRAYNAHAELWSERAKASGMVPGGQWNCFQQPAADSASVSLHGDLDPAGLVPPEHYPGVSIRYPLFLCCAWLWLTARGGCAGGAAARHRLHEAPRALRGGGGGARLHHAVDRGDRAPLRRRHHHDRRAQRAGLRARPDLNAALRPVPRQGQRRKLRRGGELLLRRARGAWAVRRPTRSVGRLPSDGRGARGAQAEWHSVLGRAGGAGWADVERDAHLRPAAAAAAAGGVRGGGMVWARGGRARHGAGESPPLWPVAHAENAETRARRLGSGPTSPWWF